MKLGASGLINSYAVHGKYRWGVSVSLYATPSGGPNMCGWAQTAGIRITAATGESRLTQAARAWPSNVDVNPASSQFYATSESLEVPTIGASTLGLNVLLFAACQPHEALQASRVNYRQRTIQSGVLDSFLP